MDFPASRFQIGQQFMSPGKHPRLCTVTDILRTYNAEGSLIHTRYEATHAGPFGSSITNHDVCETSIARRAVPQVMEPSCAKCAASKFTCDEHFAALPQTTA
jgi:hypothetical protein